MEMMKGLQHLSYAERLRELSLKEKAWGRLINADVISWSQPEEKMQWRWTCSLFLVVFSARTRGNGNWNTGVFLWTSDSTSAVCASDRELAAQSGCGVSIIATIHYLYTLLPLSACCTDAVITKMTQVDIKSKQTKAQGTTSGKV